MIATGNDNHETIEPTTGHDCQLAKALEHWQAEEQVKLEAPAFVVVIVVVAVVVVVVLLLLLLLLLLASSSSSSSLFFFFIVSMLYVKQIAGL